MAALQLVAAFFLAIFGSAIAFHASGQMEMAVGAFLGACGLSFIALLVINTLKRA